MMPLCSPGCSWAYTQSGWSAIAALAPLVFQALEAGDAAAELIVTEAVAALVQSVKAVANRLQLGASGEPFPIVLSGGALAEGAPLLPLLRAALSAQLRCGRSVIPAVDSAMGAAMLAGQRLHDT
mmetsp:Transcript_46245/g.118072  ORF Transcript_46245/g.118072 Transcript_46245/m.118072 type:complete len:125 (+) Transcript_46245:650-1024(+)